MMRRGFVERRFEIVAQRGGQRGLIARLHGDGVDQRREQVLALRAEQIAQRLGFGGETLPFAFGVFEGTAGFGFGALRFGQRFARGGGGGAGGFGQRAGAFGGVFGVAHVRRLRRSLHGAVEARLRFAELHLAALGQSRGEFAAAFGTGLAGIPVGEFGGQPFERAFGFAERFVEARGQRVGFGQFVGGAGDGGFERFGFRRQRAQCGLRVVVERTVAFDVLLGLADTLAQTLRRFAGAGFFFVELFARDGEAVQRGVARGFLVAQRRQFGGGIGLGGRGFGGVRGAAFDRGDGGGEFFLRRAQAQFRGGPAQMMRQRFGLADIAGEIAVARRLSRLALQAVDLTLDLADHIVEPAQIHFGRAQA